MKNTRTKRRPLPFIALLFAAGLLAGCAGAAPEAEAATADMAPAEGGFGYGEAEMEMATMEEPAAEEVYDDAAPETAVEGGGPGLTLPQDDRKVIMNAWASMETLEFSETCATLQKAVAEFGGYVSYTDMSGSAEAGDRYASFTIRVPAEKYTGFMAKMETAGNVTSRSEQSQDVTDQYVDVEARLKSLRTQETRLLKMMEESAKLSDIILVQEQLSEVQYQIESYEGTRRSMDNLVSYSTVDVSVYEVKETTPVGEVGYGEAVAAAWRESWQGVGRFAKNAGVALVWLVPVLLSLLLIAVPVGIIVLVAVRAAHRRRAQKAAEAPTLPAGTPPWQPAPEDKKGDEKK